MTEERAKGIIDEIGIYETEFSRKIGKHKSYTYNWKRYKVPATMALALLSIEKLMKYVPKEEIIGLLENEEVRSV